MLRKDKLILFMLKAQHYANLFSKDPSTKVGSIFLNDDYTELTNGFNGMPRSVDESIADRWLRPTKYWFTEHGERNGIFNLARRTLKGQLCVCTEVPSVSDMRALASVGISHFYAPFPELPTLEFNAGLQMFKEVGITYVDVNSAEFQKSETKQDVKVAKFLEHAKMGTAIFNEDPFASQCLFLEHDDFSVLSSGYSGTPRGMDTRQDMFVGQDRATWVESSVRNAIYNLVRPILKGSTVLITHTTCVECARAVISVGVSNVVYVQPSEEMISRWGSSFENALAIFKRLNIEVLVLTEDDLKGMR